MGANAQTSVPLFVANSVLTAAQQNISAATGVPVFATTVTRDAAFGGSNKVLAEGQLCYLESTDVVQQYNGSSWITVGPATAGALVRVGGGTLSGSSTAFTNVFSATYDAYKIVFTNVAPSATSNYLQMILGATTSNYWWAYTRADFVTGTVNANSSGGAASSFGDLAQGVTFGFTMDLQNPFLAAKTSMQLQSGGYNTSVLSKSFNGAGFLSDTTSYTGFTVSMTAGTFTGTVNVYGYALS